MPKLTVKNNTYDYPDEGTEAGTWGADATGWATDINDVVNSLAGSGTINETSTTLLTTGTNAEVPGLLFNSATTRSAIVLYTIVRITSSQSRNETGLLFINYDNGGPGWKMSRVMVGSSEPTQTILDITGTSIGQVTYTASALAGTDVTYYIRFKSISSLQPT